MIKDGYIVSNTRKGKDGQLIHELNDQPSIAYTEVRSGLSWPTHSSQAYYCIFGEVYDRYYDYRNRETRRPLKFLAEGEADNLDKLFDIMTDDAVMLKCSAF